MVYNVQEVRLDTAKDAVTLLACGLLMEPGRSEKAFFFSCYIYNQINWNNFYRDHEEKIKVLKKEVPCECRVEAFDLFQHLYVDSLIEDVKENIAGVVDKYCQGAGVKVVIYLAIIDTAEDMRVFTEEEAEELYKFYVQRYEVGRLLPSFCRPTDKLETDDPIWKLVVACIELVSKLAADLMVAFVQEMFPQMPTQEQIEEYRAHRKKVDEKMVRSAPPQPNFEADNYEELPEATNSVVPLPPADPIDETNTNPHDDDKEV